MTNSERKVRVAAAAFAGELPAICNQSYNQHYYGGYQAQNQGYTSGTQFIQNAAAAQAQQQQHYPQQQQEQQQQAQQQHQPPPPGPSGQAHGVSAAAAAPVQFNVVHLYQQGTCQLQPELLQKVHGNLSIKRGWTISIKL